MGKTARDDALSAAELARNARLVAASSYEQQMAEALASLADAVAKMGSQLHQLKLQMHHMKK